MAEDTPDDVLHMQLMEALFPDHPLGRETLGDPETIEALARDEIAGFHAEHYRPTNLVVVAAAGDLEHDAVVDGVDGCLAAAGAGTKPVRGRTDRRRSSRSSSSTGPPSRST